jgi:PERQ amino acid-rich with GYF domain-containing protein
LKPPPQSSNKDPNASGLGVNGRKSSISYGQIPGTFGLSSPASSRPSTRRQQTGDSVTGLGSPAGTGRFSRDEPSFHSRKAMDFKDGSDDRADDSKTGTSLGGLVRSNTGNILSTGPASPWSAAPSSATMGNFGSFAMVTPVNPPTPNEKRPGFGRGESRLAHLMPKESSEDVPSKPSERSWRSRPRTDTDPFGDEAPTGSAALGGGQDISPPSNQQRRAQGLDTPVRGASSDVGMSDMPGFRDSLQRGQSYQTPQGNHGEHDELSPAETNPFRSPPEDRTDQDDESYDGESLQQGRLQNLGGIPEHSANAFGSLPRGFSNAAFDGSDRSQTSSVGASKGFPTLGGLPSFSNLGGVGGWPTSGNPLGTPDRENRPGYPAAFGSSIFGSTGDLQSPGFGGINNMFGPGSSGNISGSGTIGRGSKLGSLFPAAMQAQMQTNEPDATADSGEARQGSAFGAIGRNAFPPQDTESPMRAGKTAFDDVFAQPESLRGLGPFSSSETTPGQTATSMPPTSQSSYQQPQASSDAASNQPPAAQNRQMVMPDRMRWVYLDPQGQMQGPWSGLEMHDWYKAQFFTPDLSVKKLEDSKFEPLGELIRRIGNSREPFLVPQIGVLHGPPTTQAGSAFTSSAATAGAASQPGAVQPPFAGAFPSFGTTLTAEQQNNLERRKQEEQYLMARQREFLAQQQVNLKQLQMSGIPAALHHHSSAHSLQSQPSFGSMTAPPLGMPQQAPIPGVPAFFDGPPRQLPPHGSSGVSSDFFSQEELNRLSLQERQQHFSTSGQGPPETQGSQRTHAQQINAMFPQNPDAQREAARIDQNDPQGFKARLREFEQLRAQHDLEEAAQSSANASGDSIGPPQQIQLEFQTSAEVRQEDQHKLETQEPLSLTQQVQKAASAKQSPLPAPQPESPWAKVTPGLPMPFPAPQSTTPLPAPTAQRGRSALPEALNVEARSRSETPEVAVATPSIAPWAKEPTEAPKGPSLKEIQEAEAKKAAKAEEMAAAARRTHLEQEMKILTSQPVAQAPGLPTSSTWGSTSSPANHTNAPSAWATATAAKTPVSSTSAASKKTLADIQREEESRKLRLAAAAAVTQPPQGIPGGKRYADLASKPSAAGPATGGPWSTVGAGGKVKIPTGPAATAPQAVRAASSSATPTAARAARPTPAVRSATTSTPTGTTTAKDEFNKWAKGTLVKGLNSNINGLYSKPITQVALANVLKVDEFLSMISGFPSEAIADSVYANSQLMDGRRFAEEFLRRRKLAEKGVVEPSSTGSGTALSATGEKAGWSEVAKKGPPKEESTAGFKVVPNKKKGKK